MTNLNLIQIWANILTVIFFLQILDTCLLLALKYVLKQWDDTQLKLKPRLSYLSSNNTYWTLNSTWHSSQAYGTWLINNTWGATSIPQYLISSIYMFASISLFLFGMKKYNFNLDCKRWANICPHFNWIIKMADVLSVWLLKWTIQKLCIWYKNT